MPIKLKLPPKFGRWLAIAGAAAFLIVIIGGPSGFLAIYSTHKKTVGMEKEIVRLMAQSDSLNNVIERLKHDTVFIERMAREKLGMAKPNEKVFKFINESR